MAKAAKTKAEKSDGQILSFRVSGEILRMLDDLVERTPLAQRSNLSREAMRIGLEEIERDPARLKPA